MIYAVILNNEVVNRMIWDDKTTPQYAFPYDKMIPDNEGNYPIGLMFDGEKWYMPEKPYVEPEPTIDDRVETLEQTIEALITVLNSKGIAP